MYRRSLLIERWNPTCVYKSGTAIWENHEGKYHRNGDQPAIIFSKGDMGWCKDGQMYRAKDKPAVVYASGCARWYKDGEIHRSGDMPAIIYGYDNFSWYKNGKIYFPPQEIQDYWKKYYQEYFEAIR